MIIEARRAGAAAFMAFGICARFPVPAHAAAGEFLSMPEENKKSALNESMRKLWAEHVIWTRAYVVAAIGGGSDAPDVAVRLLKNQADIGAAFVPYYGKEAGAKLAELLKQHILIAADVVAGVKAGDDAKFKEADARWHENANDIAVFLSGINLAWSKKELVGMFNDHLALTAREAVSRLNKKWSADISAFDEILGQMMMMADDLANGIIKQFPEKF